MPVPSMDTLVLVFTLAHLQCNLVTRNNPVLTKKVIYESYSRLKCDGGTVGQGVDRSNLTIKTIWRETNFLHGEDMNNPDKLLNQRRLYY